MAGTKHLVKKYANGRLYDATDKKYVTMADIEKFMDGGVAFSVVVSKTDEDITETVKAKLKGEKAAAGAKKKAAKVTPVVEAKTTPETVSDSDELSSLLGRLLRKGSDSLSEFPRKSAELWHGAMGMAEEEFDKRVKQLVKGREISESEAKRLREEVGGFARNLKGWLGDKVEERIEDMASMMNLATRDQLEELESKIEALNAKLEALEKLEPERTRDSGSGRSGAVPGETAEDLED
jgi:polyhydroxyalkanoate synthesis regulator protein